MLVTYFFVEYVRPQMIYPVVAALPLGRLTLALTMIAYVVRIPPRRPFHLGDAAVLIFATIVYLSGLFAVYPAASSAGLYVALNWLLVYFLVSRIVTTPRRMFIFLGLFLLWSLKLSLFGARTFAMRGFAFTDWGIMGPAGWFQNSGELAIQMAVIVPMSLYFVLSLRGHMAPWKTWALLALLPGTAALTVIGTSSRGGLLALAAVVLLLMVQSRRRFRSFVLAASVFAVAWYFVPDEQRARLDTMGEDQTSMNRIDYWNDGIEILNAHPLLGIGYRNWIPYYRTNYNPLGELPHNIIIEAGAELGYLGLLGFLLLAVATLTLNRRTRRLVRNVPYWGPFLRNTAFGLDAALVAFLVAGQFVTVLYYPYFWVNLGMTAALYQTTRLASRSARIAAPDSEPALHPPQPRLRPAAAGAHRMGRTPRPSGLTR